MYRCVSACVYTGCIKFLVKEWYVGEWNRKLANFEIPYLCYWYSSHLLFIQNYCNNNDKSHEVTNFWLKLNKSDIILWSKCFGRRNLFAEWDIDTASTLKNHEVTNYKIRFCLWSLQMRSFLRFDRNNLKYPV